MARVQGEIKCIPTNTEKYISFSFGNLRIIDSVNFLLSSLDKLVKGIDEFPIMQSTEAEENKRRLLLKKGIYPNEYMDSFERCSETKLEDKEKFHSSLAAKESQMRNMRTRKKSGRHSDAKILDITITCTWL